MCRLLLVPVNGRHYDAPMRSLGKGLQVVGLTLLPLACMMEWQGSLGRGAVAYMLVMMVVGVIAFVLGRYVEGYSR
jgi:hypothetical protein